MDTPFSCWSQRHYITAIISFQCTQSWTREAVAAASYTALSNSLRIVGGVDSVTLRIGTVDQSRTPKLTRWPFQVHPFDKNPRTIDLINISL